MPKINKANRQVCDVDIRDVATKKPFLFFDTANTTTQNITGESVFAMAKGTKRIAFANPVEGTATIYVSSKSYCKSHRRRKYPS